MNASIAETERSGAPIVAPQQFVLATRDTGYKNLSAAISELVDNSLQARATDIRIFVRECEDQGDRSVVVGVLDNGCGMSASTLACALQFGGTERFGDRKGFGRFGMGLPNSSVSQTRRLEVYSWQRPNLVLFTYLDVDEIISGQMRGIPVPIRQAIPKWIERRPGSSGTLVLWMRCDRLGRYRLPTILERLERTLERVYRFALWQGVRITINEKIVQPFDPLFLRSRSRLDRSRLFGPPLRYEVETPTGPSTIEVRFTELPVAKWHEWSADDKRRKGIVAGAGVSVVRAGREIDYGWHLLGGKRRENYDDWWRCEIQFSPAADELFGVTHSKQGVTPRAELRLLMSADMELVARTLNRRVREAFERARTKDHRTASIAAARQDPLLLPPASVRPRMLSSGGLRYRLEYKPIPAPEFYDVCLRRSVVVVTVNTDHPFFTQVYRRASQAAGALDRLDRLVLAAARADLEFRNPRERGHVLRIRRAWGDALAAFLSS